MRRSARAVAFGLAVVALSACGTGMTVGDGGAGDGATEASSMGPGAGPFAGRYRGTADFNGTNFDVAATVANGTSSDMQITASGMRTEVSPEMLTCALEASRDGETGTILMRGSCSIGMGTLQVVSGTVGILGDEVTANVNVSVRSGADPLTLRFMLTRVR